MRRMTCLLAFAMFGFFVATVAMAEEETAKTVPITTVAFNSGATYDGTIPSEIQPVADAVKKVYPDATFGTGDGVLLVGLKLKDVPDGKIASITWRSDCPVNSIYQVTPNPVLAQVFQPMLEAWTRARHAHLGLGEAAVERYTQNEDYAEVVLLASAK